jgi:hypothetical protein
LRTWLRRHHQWLTFQELNREGWHRAGRRAWFQRRILDTPPIRTAREGPVEVRSLTWRRDWMNLLWTLKSYYHFAEVDYPLYIHDGGLTARQVARLRQHFPDATIVGRDEADQRITAEFMRRGLERSLAFRARNVNALKLFDFFASSEADYVVTLDSDIVFFRRPELLIVPPEGVRRNRFNRDCGYWYNMNLDELEASFGLRPPPQINSGLGLVSRSSVDFETIELWLENHRFWRSSWVHEQTILALCSVAFGFEFLPSTYKVSTEPGLDLDMVCKHYPGFFRTHLYSEGMNHLIRSGFLHSLQTETREQPASTPEYVMEGHR